MSANAKATRVAIEAMSDEDLREAVKGIPSDILAEELWARVKFFEDKNTAIDKIQSTRR